VIVNRKADFFYTKRIDSILFVIRIELRLSSILGPSAVCGRAETFDVSFRDVN